jgi:hypothetical protein
MTETGDRAVVRRKPAKQPERLAVANAGSLQMARRPDLVEIAPDVEPHHVPWMVSGTAGGGGDGSAEAKLSQVQSVPKRGVSLSVKIYRLEACATLRRRLVKVGAWSCRQDALARS